MIINFIIVYFLHVYKFRLDIHEKIKIISTIMTEIGFGFSINIIFLSTNLSKMSINSFYKSMCSYFRCVDRIYSYKHKFVFI